MTEPVAIAHEGEEAPFVHHLNVRTTPNLQAQLNKALAALRAFMRMEKSVMRDIKTAHGLRGSGASEAMREDDRDMRTDLVAAFDFARAALSEIEGRMG